MPMPPCCSGWAESLGQFSVRQFLTVAFTILLLFFLYEHGAALARELQRTLRAAMGDRADRYLFVATRAVHASVNSMLAVALFDALATALAYVIAGAPRAMVWAAITGSLAAVPFLGYAAVAAMAVQLMVKGLPGPALWSLLLGSIVLMLGDKLVRPMVVREGMRLPFAWVLMGCVGGFGALGLAGLVIGPAALSLAHELWAQRLRERGH